MKKKSRSRLSKVLAASAFVLLIAVMALVYARFGAKPVSGLKAVMLEVVSSEGKTTAYVLRTDAEYLLGAMEDAEGLEFSGYEGPYGMVITEVNGETADFSVDSAYWGFSVTGEYCNYGVSEQPVNDGDVFTIAYSR